MYNYAQKQELKAYMQTRRRKELGVSVERMAWLFKYLLLLAYRIVHDPCILALAIP